MDLSILVAYAAALCAAGLSLVTICQRQRSISSWLLAGGLLAFALDSLFAALAADSLQPLEVVAWSRWRFVSMAFLPILWFLFSLIYSRGNAHDFLRRRRWFLLALLVVPVILICYPAPLIISVARPVNGLRWTINLGPTAIFLHAGFILAAISILTSLERPFRISVGTIRWRIKFMLLGAAALWTVRAYTSTQVIISHSSTASLLALDSIGLLVGSVLIARALFRAGHFPINLYPSQAVLYNSVAVLLGGIYLLLIGVLAKATHLLDSNIALEVRA